MESEWGVDGEFATKGLTSEGLRAVTSEILKGEGFATCAGAESGTEALSFSWGIWGIASEVDVQEEM